MLGFGTGILLMKSGYINRGFAVFFFIFSMTDLCCLSVFCDKGISPAVAAPVIETEDSQQEDESQPCQSDECCFCCAHVVPSSQIAMAALAVDSPDSEQYPTLLPKPPPRALFRPPRSS